MRERIPYFSQLGLILTRQCNIQCDHCIEDCSPHSCQKLDTALAERIVREAAALRRVQVIGFTGGEPFLDFHRLSRLVQLCASLGLKAAVTTNGYWARSSQGAKERLASLLPLTSLSISTDSFHQRFVPIASVQNAILACQALGVKCFVRVSFLNDPVAEVNRVKEQLKQVHGTYELQSQPVTPNGRAARRIPRDSIFSYNVQSLPCESADHPAVDTQGDVLTCCGPPLTWKGLSLFRLGNLYKKSLSQIVWEADRNPVVHILRLWGPAELLRLAKRQARKERLTVRFPSIKDFSEICALCKYMASNSTLRNLFLRALQGSRTYHRVAVARLIELAETNMLTAEPEMTNTLPLDNPEEIVPMATDRPGLTRAPIPPCGCDALNAVLMDITRLP